MIGHKPENKILSITSRTTTVVPSFQVGVALAARARNSSSVFLNDSVRHFLTSLSKCWESPEAFVKTNQHKQLINSCHEQYSTFWKFCNDAFM